MNRALVLAVFVLLVSACAANTTADGPSPSASAVFATATLIFSQPESELPPTGAPDVAPRTPTAAATLVVSLATTPALTGTRPPPPVPTPIVPISFSITPTITQHIGDRLTMNWKAAGDEAAICPVDGTRLFTLAALTFVCRFSSMKRRSR